MIDRKTKTHIEKALARQSVVALIGPRQVGKTTLSLDVAKGRSSVYLDLESSRDRAKLSEPDLFFAEHKDDLIILDEIHRLPEIFLELRGIVDERRRNGQRVGQFLILGSAAIELLNKSSETLAGRIEYVNMGPVNISEIDASTDQNKLWLRGGFPDSFLASSDEDSFSLRDSFIQTYLERDVALFGPRVPSETLRRLWIMLAHNQGSLLNVAKLSSNLEVRRPTISSYVDLLVDLLLVRRLQPYAVNVGKRLVKSPKTYVRDSGLLHALLHIETMDDLLGHPVVGNSWEGFVIENILSILPSRTQSFFYRTQAGAEVDLVLDFGGQKGKWAIEIKRGSAPKVEKSLRNALVDLEPTRSFIVYSGEDTYPISKDITVLSLSSMMEEIKKI